MADPVVSIVISAYNRAEKLKLALQALQDQGTEALGRAEVLVIDNNSVDQTKFVAESFLSELPLSYHNQGHQGLGHVRDLGFRLAEGEYVAFLDEDAIPHVDWLGGLLERLSELTPDGVIGPIFPYYDSEKPAWFLDEYEIRSKGELARWLVPGEEGSGSNMVWRKKILEELGGFDTRLGMTGEFIAGGEDADLFRRYWQLPGVQSEGGKIFYDPALIVAHWVPEFKMDVQYILRRNYAAGIAAAEMRRNNPFFQKALKALQLVGEMAFIVLRFPLTRAMYPRRENWVVEEWRRFTLRAGWLAALLGLRASPRL